MALNDAHNSPPYKLLIYVLMYVSTVRESSFVSGQPSSALLRRSSQTAVCVLTALVCNVTSA